MTKHRLLIMNDLSVEEIHGLLQDADAFSNLKRDWQLDKAYLVANLFFEPSTRTHYSFVSAEHGLGLKVVDPNMAVSSTVKGETLYDTVKTFEMVGYEGVVIRHPQDYYFKELDGINIPIINAGDGCGNHPSQCLLDMLTIYQEFGHLDGLKLAIIGDIKHSRVARSNYDTFMRMGCEVKFSGPDFWIDDSQKYMPIDEAVAWADIVMMLRIQKERIPASEMPNMSDEEYLTKDGLTLKRYQKMQQHAIIMHPAPVNRGVEIADELVECERSRIFKQMHNGLLVRKAIIKRAFGGKF